MARFRWTTRKTTSSQPLKWAVRQFHIGAADPANGDNSVGQATLMEDFQEAELSHSVWSSLIGGQVETPPTVLGQGRAVLFQGRGRGLRLLESVGLDLRSAEAVQFMLDFVGDGHVNSLQRRLASVIYLQCSVDKGTTWDMLGQFLPDDHLEPNVAHAAIPSQCKAPSVLLRWWQPYDPDRKESQIPALAWAVDNILVDRSDRQLTELYDSFQAGASNRSLWQFFPENVTSGQLCEGDVASLNLFASKDNDQTISLTSRRITLRDNYAAYFKIRTSCQDAPPVVGVCRPDHGQIRFEMRRGFNLPSWDLAQPSCLPAGSDETDYDVVNGRSCLPNVFHPASIYAANRFNSWQRVVIPLHPISMATSWQFRWVWSNGKSHRWALKDVYIGPECTLHCHGHGDCIEGRCRCDTGYGGSSCQVIKRPTAAGRLPLIDNFDSAGWPPTPSLWDRVDGASPGVGCGSLVPHAHGKHLHFDGCFDRSATTIPIDVTKAGRVAFVLRTGTSQLKSTCRVQPAHAGNRTSANRVVLLQYSFDGVQWLLLASHGQRDFLQARRVMYKIPTQFRHPSIRFRWWQPQHGGATWDQWALDNVEILP